MSPVILVRHVSDVLLADGWHSVADKSFAVDSYEYLDGRFGDDDDDRYLAHESGDSGVCASGFSFLENDEFPCTAVEPYKPRISGPLTAILAVRERVS